MKKIVLLFIAFLSLYAGGGDIFRMHLLFDRFEVQSGGVKSWDVSAYGGYDIDKLYIYSEGEDNNWQNELVFSHAITPFWDLQAGFEMDREQKTRGFGVIALSGLAPYWIETRTKLLVGGGGAGIDFDFEYDTLFTQRLILTSRIESRWMGKAYRSIGVGQGLNFVEAGFRLRYELQREFAPYVGITFKRNFGETKRITEEQSESAFVFGIRFWF